MYHIRKSDAKSVQGLAVHGWNAGNIKLMKILLLEDNPNRITYFQNALKGHSVEVCRHAKAAKKALRKHQFDLIFLDHDLQGIPADPDSDNCGSAVARTIVDHHIAYRAIILHTENDLGRDSMDAILPDAFIFPYSKIRKMGLRAVLKIVMGDLNE